MEKVGYKDLKNSLKIPIITMYLLLLVWVINAISYIILD